MVLSRLQLARTFPSGEKATPSTEPWWPLSLRTPSPPPKRSAGTRVVRLKVINGQTRVMGPPFLGQRRARCGPASGAEAGTRHRYRACASAALLRHSRPAADDW